ncbi:hypothetical protein OESDEN_15674 [Oesophagostomum dentatum]|uniref:Uncharacterized protein n=1 Tax=Oesophagostomum dentatum TaxID=61180 RepID=A0A0B1SN51_OESDE|nr:hypothetical protein OESDEN_15674 [Oesophagostomum dentatum]
MDRPHFLKMSQMSAVKEPSAKITPAPVKPEIKTGKTTAKNEKAEHSKQMSLNRSVAFPINK